MNLVIIADGHPREWPILHKVSRQFPEAVWIKPTYEESDPEEDAGQKEPFSDRMGWLYRQFRDRVRRRLTKLKVEMPPPQFKNTHKLPYYELDKGKGLDLMRNLEPDVIVTCRAPILKPELLQQASWCGINVHFGLVPEYRGNEGLFWAGLKGDTNSFGGSIHMLEDGVDTGSVIVDAFPELTGRESETMIDLKVSEVLGRALVKCLQNIARKEGVPPGKPQDRKGRNYRASERTIFQDLKYYRQRLTNRFPSQNERLQFY